jgi:hypothetical protein
VCSAVAVLLLAAVAGASTITITLEATPLSGNEYRIDVYGQVADTDPGSGGIFFTAVTLTTPGSVGKAVPKEKFPPPNSKKTVISYGPRVMGGGFTLTPAVIKDVDLDGDMDSVGGGFTDTANWLDSTIGVGAPELLMSQTWIVNAQGVVIEAAVDPLSRFYDLVDPQFITSYSTQFDDQTGDSVTIGAVEDELPVAGVGGPYGEEDWPMTPPGWNNPAREIAVTGTGTDDKGIKSYQWLIAAPGSDTFEALADAVVVDPTATGVDASTAISIQAIANALHGGDVGALPGKYGPGGPDASYNYKLKLLVTDTIDQTGEAETTIFVPEPGTLVLLGLGGLGALIRRRRS